MKTIYLPLFAALVLLTGCAMHTGPSQRDSISIDRDAAKSLRAEVRMGAGELHVSGGTPKWVQGEFEYNVATWKPNVRYTMRGSVGEFTVEQPSASSFHFGSTKNEWNLRLNEEIPTEFAARLGAGEAHLELGSLSLRNVEIDMGAGELRLDLRGKPASDFDVRIRGGAGEATIYLPRDVGILAKATGGLGEVKVRGLRQRDDQWVNDAYGTSKVQLRLDVKGGVGAINLIAE